MYEHRRTGWELARAGSGGRPDPQRDAAILASMVGNRAFGGILARTPPIAPPDRQLPGMPADAEMVALDQIEYDQPGISFTTRDKVSVGKMAAAMIKWGWTRSQPADIVRMRDGRLVSLDHRRLWAAARANIKHVSARVHSETDKLSAKTAERFAIDKKSVPTGTNPRTNQPWKAGDEPGNWGDAVRFRSAVQEFMKAGKLGNVGYNPGMLAHGAGTRDPKFPAEGSKDPPMRLQPGPLTRDEPYQGAGTVIKSGNKRTTVQSGPGANAAGTIGGRGTRPPGGGTVGGGPNVVVDPSLQTGGAANRVPGGGRGSVRSTPPRGGTSDFDEGGHDITGGEVEATSGMTSGPTLLGMIGQWLLRDFFKGQQAKIDEILTKKINDEVEQRLKFLAYRTIALQSRGDIAYVQVTVKQTSGSMSTYDPGVAVMELDGLRVSEWSRQDHDFSSFDGVTKVTDTNSFALPLLPAVIDIAAAQLTGQIRDIDAQLKSSPSSATALQERRAQLERCVSRLKQRGPHVPSFSFLGGECLDVLPTGRQPPG